VADAPSSNPWEPLLLLLGVLALMVALIWARGGMESLKPQGFFILPSGTIEAPSIEMPQLQPQDLTNDNQAT